MEPLFLTGKTKKRKTRKYLNEMRRRSRTSLTSIKLKLKDCEGTKNYAIIKKKKISQSLSNINMFTKAVRSETITRPVITNPHPDSHQNHEEKFSSSQNTVELECLSSSLSCNDYSTSPVFIEKNNVNFNNIAEHFPVNIVTRRKCHKRRPQNKITSEEASNLRESAFTVTNIPENNLLDHLHDELMDAIPMYIRNNFANHINEDVIFEKSRRALQNIYAINCDQGIKNETCFVLNNDMTKQLIKKNIVQNPMDYLRLGYVHHNINQGHKRESSEEDTTSSIDYSYSQFTGSQNVQTLLSHTPEYTYFPHKLN